MSVVTMYSEEYPEHGAACATAFQLSAGPTPASLIKPRTSPLSIEVTDFDQHADKSFERLGTSATFGTAATTTASCSKKASTPDTSYITMEDAEQSAGASATSKNAAALLAAICAEDADDADDADDIPAPTSTSGRAQGRYARQGICAPAYCC